MSRARSAKLVLFGAALGLGAPSLGCPSKAPPEPQFEDGPALEPARPSAQPLSVAAPSDYLDAALLEGSYEPAAVARVLAWLPRPTPNGSAFVALVNGVIDVFTELRAQPERLREQLDATGLDADARIHMSARALDGRFAAAAKRLGELSSDGGGSPAQLQALASQASTLGLHMRASLPTQDSQRLLAVLDTVLQTDPGHARARAEERAATDPAAAWEAQCSKLEDTRLCRGWPRLLAWARETTDASGHPALRVDLIYLFHGGADEADLERAIAAADAWGAQPLDRAPALDRGASMELRVHAAGMLALLRAEALADAATEFCAEPSSAPYPGYLDRERALRELYPPERLFEGLALGIDYTPSADSLAIDMRWLPARGREALTAEIFAPIDTRPGMPSLLGVCERALACGRFGGLSSLLRYAPLAAGAFSDLTGTSRVLRQAGERGDIMLLMTAWPHVLGTGAVMAGGGRGVVSEAQAAVLGDSDGVGFVVQDLGEDREGDEQWAGYLRLSTAGLAALRPAAGLAGISLEPVELPGVELPVDRGAYEDTPIYFVEEEQSAWIVAASEGERVSELLNSAREIDERLEPMWFVRMASLGAFAAQQEVSYSDDPSVRAWLDAHTFELRGQLHASSPQMKIELRGLSPRGSR